jgi:hypothetical protein
MRYKLDTGGINCNFTTFDELTLRPETGRKPLSLIVFRIPRILSSHTYLTIEKGRVLKQRYYQ